MRQYDLVADGDTTVGVLHANSHLELSVVIERADHVDVVVQVDAAVLHEYHEAPKVSAMIERIANRIGQLAVNAALHRQCIELDDAAQRLELVQLVPIIAGE